MFRLCQSNPWALALLLTILGLRPDVVHAQSIPTLDVATSTASQSNVSQTNESRQHGLAESPSTEQWSDLHRIVKLERSQVSSVVSNALMFGLIGLLPIVALMATSYVRLIIVLGILRQAIGGTHTPPTQVMTALALFLTVLVMMPVWQQVKQAAVDPYFAAESPIAMDEALRRGAIPLKRFMSQQIIAANNASDVWLFYKYLPAEQQLQAPKTFNDVPIQVLLPAFLISELKMAFAIGFQIFLPFLIVDLLVTSLTTSMGMIMLPPSTISLPLKLALFVLVDGWHLLVGMLLQSFAALG